MIRNFVCLFFIFTIFYPNLFGQAFNGTIYVEQNEVFNEKAKETHNKHLSMYGSAFGDHTYEESLKTLIKYKICGDTLIKTYNKNNVNVSNYQLKNDLYAITNSERMLKLKIKTSLNEVKKFRVLKKEEILIGIKTDLFSGYTPTNETVFTLNIDRNQNFSQNKYSYLFSDIFNEHGLILKTIMHYVPQNLIRESKVIKLEDNSCPCAMDFDFSRISKTINQIDQIKQNENNLNFKKTQIETITMDDLLLKNGKDTTIIEETDRQLLAFQGRSTLSENVNIENIKGHYALIDLWATWCKPCLYAMPALGDIYGKYRYDGLKVISISLDVETAIDKWKKTIEKENMYWDNYIMPEGFDADLCRQLGIKDIPHYILLDPEGRIMLENAPGPSDPMLHEVLDRVLKGRK